MRKPRELLTGASYHVLSRANRKEMIFTTNEVKEMFLQVVRRAKEKYNFSIKNFCIMGNHYHIIIKPLGNENLSRIMQWILGVFAMQYNRKFRLTGHVWSDRFTSKIIYTMKQYLITFHYISQNPVRAKLVQNASDYAYNGISFIQRGGLDILERPPNDLLQQICATLQE